MYAVFSVVLVINKQMKDRDRILSWGSNLVGTEYAFKAKPELSELLQAYTNTMERCKATDIK